MAFRVSSTERAADLQVSLWRLMEHGREFAEVIISSSIIQLKPRGRALEHSLIGYAQQKRTPCASPAPTTAVAFCL